MKKLFSKLVVFLSISICLCFLYVPCFVITSRASNTSRVVVAHTGTWGSFPFTVPGNKYYTIADPTGLTVSNYATPTAYYTNDGIVFDSVQGNLVFTTVLNSITGIVMQAENLPNYIADFFTFIFLKDSDHNIYVKNGLYDSQGNFYGFAINDISGCTYARNSSENVTIGRDFSDTVLNYYNYYEDTSPDFFTFYPPSKTFYASHFDSAWNSTLLTNYYSITDTIINASVRNGSQPYESVLNPNFLTGGHSASANAYTISGIGYAVWDGSSPNGQDYASFCNSVSLSSGNNRLSYEIFYAGNLSNYFMFDYYDRNGNKITSCDVLNCSNGQTSTLSISNSLPFGTPFYKDFPLGQDVTFYRTTNIKTSLDNHSYEPETFLTDQYYAYQSNNTDSFNVTKTQVDNSITYNGDIYNDAVGDYYNYYDNGYYDTSSSTTNITNITNNYYSGSNDPDDPADPDDPDDPDDSSGTLDEILRAILRFFNAIGDIIGTLLASIINLIDSVLEALAGVMENLTGMSDFFAALFSWIPEPVPQILGAGFGICLVCGIIKFIRG